MVNESMPNGTLKYSQEGDDTQIEAEAILADAKKRHEALFAYIEKIPAEEAELVVELSKTFDEACKGLQATYEKLSAGGDTDTESNLAELRKYSEALVRAETAIYHMTAQMDMLPPEGESDTVPVPVEPDTTPKEPAPADPIDNSKKSVSAPKAKAKEASPDDHYLKEDVQRLKQRDDAILYREADSSQGFRPLKDLRLDIEAIFEADGQSVSAIQNFYQSKFKGPASEIARNRNLMREATSEKKAELYESIKKSYEQILSDASEWLQNKEVYDEGRTEAEETFPDRQEVEILADIKEAEKAFLDLREQQKNNPDFAASVHYEAVLRALDAVDNYPAQDPSLVSKHREKQLSVLSEALDKLFLEVSGEDAFEDVIVDLPTDVPQVSPSSTELAEVEATEYINGKSPAERTTHREKSLEAKQQFRDIKKQYHQALEVHQNEMKNRGMFRKIASLGMKPELPESIKALEAEYLVRRKDYVRELDARLGQRGKKFELSQDDMKRAFARKFILRPQEELLKLQEHNLLSPEAQGRMRSIAAKFAKHKWTIRFGTVALAGVAGAVTGGTALAFAGAASWQVGKIAGSAGVGMAAGGVTKKITQKMVDRVAANLPKIAEGVEKNFSVENLNSLDRGLMQAKQAVKDAEKFKKVATVVAGGLAGIAAGNAFAENVPDAITDLTRPTGLSEEALGNLETSKIIPKVTETPEVPTQPAYMEKVALPFDGREGGLVYEHHVNDISFGSEFKTAALTDAENKALSSFVRVKLDDILVKPNTPVPEIETKLQAAIEKSFGDSQWWKDSPIKSVDIGKVEVVLMSGTEPTPEIIKGEYIVKSGDTLWEIAEDKFKDQLKDLSPQERNVVLDRLFDRVKADSGLLESLSIDSNKIDLIKTGESIDLGGLQDELTQVLEDREIVEQFRTSGPLPVEADGGVKSVPITVVEKPIPGGTEVVINNERSYTEAAPAKPVITPDITTSTKGYYEMSPQHVREEIRQYFGSASSFKFAVDQAADQVSSRDYNFLERFSNAYESPFKKFKDMTIDQFRTEIQSKTPAELDAYLTKNHYKSEAITEWVKEINKLEYKIPHTKTDTIGSMFEQSVFQDRVDEKMRSNLYRN
jgi:LysM repeat protein